MYINIVNIKTSNGFVFDVEKPDFVKVNIFSKKGKNNFKYLAKVFPEDSWVNKKDVLIVEFLVTHYSYLLPEKELQSLKIPYGIIVQVSNYSIGGLLPDSLHQDEKGRYFSLTVYHYTEKIIKPPTDGKSLDLYINAVLEEDF